MRLLLSLVFAMAVAASCGSSNESAPTADDTSTSTTASTSSEGTTETESEGIAESPSEEGPGGYGFDRSDPEGGIANIMEAFATDEMTATCIFEAWGDVADVPPAELTAELMTFEVCNTSIFQLMTGDPRFTGNDG